MYTVLLSGGSGKRLWPLSNDLRSKQYIKIFDEAEQGNEQISMVQRVVGQLKDSGIDKNLFICAGNSQLEIIHSQLGDIGVAVEPERRDTFPAVAISCAYALSYCGATEQDCMVILPVDPYTDEGYFKTLGELEGCLCESGADIALMGVVPDCPSTKYGYIVPNENAGRYSSVLEFREKPDEETAKQLISRNAVFNCGVFCFKISLICDILRNMGLKADYDYLYANYEKLPKISFDYQVLEKCDNMIVVPFMGMWKDLGTWNALADEMQRETIGNAIVEQCDNTRVINELDIPIVANGLENIVIAASADGILVTEKTKSENIKNTVSRLDIPPMYEERRWGTLKTVDRGETNLTRHVKMFAGMVSSYHYHEKRNEVWVFLKGTGEMILGNMKMSVSAGMSLTIPQGANHIIKAVTELEFLEVHIGEPNTNDIHRLSFDWDEVEKTTV
ncbi:MAG: cupin domain-containing protein [Ruminococcaceae bacterium]|nr:cupin domain-containing protein [Oscillospiraceae bacterium]